MSNPVFVDCPADQWTLVATAVITRQIWRVSRKPRYLYTYRETGDAAPTERSDGVLAFPLEDIDSKEISKTSPIDVYLYAIDEDGRVRVDDGPLTDDIDVNIQDQTTAFDDFFFSQQIGTPTTLTADTVFESYNIDVASIADISIGDTIFIFSGITGEERFFDAEVLGISVLTLALDRSLDFVFEDGDTVLSTTNDMNVDGSVTPQIFEIRAGGATQTLEWDITRILIENLSASAVDLSTFGDIAGGITRGLQLRDKLSATAFKQKWNVKQNKDFGLLGLDWIPFAATTPVAGQDGFNWRYTIGGQDKHGVVKRIGSNRSLQLIVQDDLTSLTSLTAIGGNHEVEP